MTSPIELVLPLLNGVKQRQGYWQAQCPAHEDNVPSLSVKVGDDGRVLAHCFAQCSVESICEKLGIKVSDLYPGDTHRQPPKRTSSFTPRQSLLVWNQARARALDDDAVARDREVYDYLSRRKLDEAWGERSYGIVATDMDLPESISFWPSMGYGLVAPLYGLDGNLASIQARRVRNGEPKTRFPKGGRAKGVVFANAEGLEVLRGTAPKSLPVILGEGFTDYLALSFLTSLPTLCTPGVTGAPDCISSWVAGRELFLALDRDEAGDRAASATADKAYRAGAKHVRQIAWTDGCNDACDALWTLGAKRLGAFLEELGGACHGASV